MREAQTTMSSELEDGNFEHAECVLLVEVKLSVPAGLGQTKQILMDSRLKLFPSRSNLGAGEAVVREVQTTMSSELEDGNFEHARYVLLVEIELSVPAGLGQTKRILRDYSG